MLICLLRHGETDWNNLGKLQGREDVPLNNLGIEQVKKATEYIKTLNLKIIITSPLLRAKMSAEIISKEITDSKIYEEMDFIEKDYGKASGMTPDERELHFPDGIWPGAEPSAKLQNRTVNALLKYIKIYNGNNIIIVSHGAAINTIIAYISENKICNEKTILKNASMSLLEKTSKGIEVLFYNKTARELVEI